MASREATRSGAITWAEPGPPSAMGSRVKASWGRVARQPRARQEATRLGARPCPEPARGTPLGSGHIPPGARRTFTCSCSGGDPGERWPS
ncbi:hypothetical protein HMPREF9057_02352 [Actinomyces sp. oral taxon 171 str. F0337]|nr:hypothetical protein HMPREF9057_02352 [Actinomyces sp. oral taxon 171 str. F0337]